MPKDGDRLPAPRTWQEKMLKAASYAACAQEHPLYQLKAVDTESNPHSLAFIDYLGKPEIIGMYINHWTGGIGQRIHIQVRDNVRIMHVRVMIRQHPMSDMVLESDHACQSQVYPLIWTYLTKTKILQPPGFCVDVIATDLPGNTSAETLIFDQEPDEL